MSGVIIVYAPFYIGGWYQLMILVMLDLQDTFIPLKIFKSLDIIQSSCIEPSYHLNWETKWCRFNQTGMVMEYKLYGM